MIGSRFTDMVATACMAETGTQSSYAFVAAPTCWLEGPCIERHQCETWRAITQIIRRALVAAQNVAHPARHPWRLMRRTAQAQVQAQAQG